MVIGETAEIGENVTLYQGYPGGRKGEGEHPIIGVMLLLVPVPRFGSITVGDNVKIGAGSVVVKSVRPTPRWWCRASREENGRRAKGVDLEHGNLPDPVAELILHLQRE